MKKCFAIFTAAAVLTALAGQPGRAQTADTGALSGTVTDAAGALVPGAQITATNNATGLAGTGASGARGFYQFPLLIPGSYRVVITKDGFKTTVFASVVIKVTETTTLNVPLQVGAVSQNVVVASVAPQLDTEDAELGSVIDERFIENLPLAARNYLQIIGLNPGVSSEVTDAGDLGRGASSLASAGGGISTGGSSTIDNNYQMNGVPVNDNLSEGEFSGGIPIPNPDTLEEFKVVTTPYDASYGRNGGANVDVLTKTGSNVFHGSVFEYLRNNDMNANTWFLNEEGQPRAILKQNQFGGTVGGPILHDKAFFFGSYQGTRQRNGLDSGCATQVLLPPLTNDRSAAGLGALFAGQRGEIQDLLGGVGPAVASDGSNINPVALAVLQMKLPDGSYMIPTPQSINTSAPSFDSEGSSSFSQACPFSEDQYMANGDYALTRKNSLQLRYFMANSAAVQTLEPANLPGASVPGFPYSNVSNFKNASVTDTHTFSQTLVNQGSVGFNRNFATNTQGEQFTWSGIGSTVPTFVNNIPGLGVANISLGGEGQDAIFIQNTFIGKDSLAWTRGRNSFRFGGDFTRNESNSPYFEYFGAGYYLSFADFLLGLDANDNGTAAAGVPYSNEYLDLALPGELSRYYRYFDASGYAQDDFKLTTRFTLNLGLRYEHIGDFTEAGGRNTQLDLSMVNPNPPATGTLQGYVVPSNYRGTPPPGVTESGNNLGIEGLGQNAVEPRVGFAWQLPNSDRLVLRGGFGMYRSRSGIAGLYQGVSAPPYSAVVLAEGSQNYPASLQMPIWQPIPTFPQWPSAAYSPSTSQSFQGLDTNFRPTISEHYSLDLQTQFTRNILFDLAYGGARSTKLIEANYVNQAVLASPSAPVNGQTTNTLANIPMRVPYIGWNPAGLLLIRSNGESWYNSLQASVTKRFSHGLQLIAAYTWARDLTDVPGAVTGGGFGGNVFGDQTDLHKHYGPDGFIRDQRFVLSYVYSIPSPVKASSHANIALGGWSLAGVTTAQSGHQLTAVQAAPNNAYGIPLDLEDYTPNCRVANSGSVESRINGSYFNTSCFTTPPVIGSDGVATAFGDAPTGNIIGPNQFVSDTSLGKQFLISRSRELGQVQFKADFFNVFNHPVFADPITAYGYGTQGFITATATNPRVIQLSLKYAF
ncbi:MAG: TonB-dependent receptor [Terracidiphilus sp.]|jgi:hypothetical protein